jgi:hypothetical protein
MARWFANQGAKSSKAKPLPPVKAVKKPRATNAQDIFAEDRRDDIRTAIKQKCTEEGVTAKEGNLKFHRIIKNEMYSELSEEDRAKYDKLAAERNSKLDQPPSREHVFE